jgi:hypothetical protein
MCHMLDTHDNRKLLQLQEAYIFGLVRKEMSLIIWPDAWNVRR